MYTYDSDFKNIPQIEKKLSKYYLVSADIMNHISKWMETYFGILYQCVNGSAMLLTAERPSRTRIVGVLGV